MGTPYFNIKIYTKMFDCCSKCRFFHVNEKEQDFLYRQINEVYLSDAEPKLSQFDGLELMRDEESCCIFQQIKDFKKDDNYDDKMKIIIRNIMLLKSKIEKFKNLIKQRNFEIEMNKKIQKKILSQLKDSKKSYESLLLKLRNKLREQTAQFRKLSKNKQEYNLFRIRAKTKKIKIFLDKIKKFEPKKSEEEIMKLKPKKRKRKLNEIVLEFKKTENGIKNSYEQLEYLEKLLQKNRMIEEKEKKSIGETIENVRKEFKLDFKKMKRKFELFYHKMKQKIYGIQKIYY